jgi:hypothetical protein
MTDKIEDAIDKLLTAVLRERAARPPESSRAFEFSATPTEALIENDTVEIACLLAIERLGQSLFDAVGSTDEMRKSLDRICDRHPESSGRRTAILDAWWNGVGSDKDRWWS